MANDLVPFEVVEGQPEDATVYRAACLYGVKVLQRTPLPVMWEEVVEETAAAPESSVPWTAAVAGGAFATGALVTAVGAGGFLPGLAIGATAFFIWDLGRDG